MQSQIVKIPAHTKCRSNSFLTSASTHTQNNNPRINQFLINQIRFDLKVREQEQL